MSRRHSSSKVTVVDGISFPSKFESEVYLQHKYRQLAGEITELEPHPVYQLSNTCIRITELHSEKVRTYTPDLRFKEKGKTVVVEAKGRMQGDNSIRYSLFKALYPDIEFRLLMQKRGGKHRLDRKGFNKLMLKRLKFIG